MLTHPPTLPAGRAPPAPWFLPPDCALTSSDIRGLPGQDPTWWLGGLGGKFDLDKDWDLCLWEARSQRETGQTFCSQTNPVSGWAQMPEQLLTNPRNSWAPLISVGSLSRGRCPAGCRTNPTLVRTRPSRALRLLRGTLLTGAVLVVQMPPKVHSRISGGHRIPHGHSAGEQCTSLSASCLSVALPRRGKSRR